MSLPKIVLETDKTVPVYDLPLRIRQGDKGDVLTVLLGKSFVTYPDLSNIDVTLIAERSDQTLVKAVATEKKDNTFSVTFPDAMYSKVGVFRRVYFKIGTDSTSDIKIEVLSGTGSSSANGNYIQDFEDLLNQAMSYVYSLNSLAGTYDAVIDNKVDELTKKMTDFVAQAQKDKDKVEQAYKDSQTQSETNAKDQRDGFDTVFNKLIADDKAEFTTITNNFNKVVADGKAQNQANQTSFDSAETKRETDFKAQNADFEKRYTAQNADFEKRFKEFIPTLQGDYDAFKKILTTDVAGLESTLTKLGADTTALQVKADEIASKLQDVDLSQMATNKADIETLQKNVKANTDKFDNYNDKQAISDMLTAYVLSTKLTEVMAPYSKSDDVKSWIATSANQTKEYAAESIKAIVGAAPETLDTIAELAAAVTDNKTLVDAVNSAITSKADKTDVDSADKKLQSNIDNLIVPISDADYQALVTAGTVDPKKLYVTPEE